VWKSSIFPCEGCTPCVLLVDAHEPHLAAELVVHRLQRRHLLHTGWAPRSPEVHHGRTALPELGGGDRGLAGTEGLQHEMRYRQVQQGNRGPGLGGNGQGGDDRCGDGKHGGEGHADLDVAPPALGHASHATQNTSRCNWRPRPGRPAFPNMADAAPGDASGNYVVPPPLTR
jgi:hypothetical protein